jgi:hypothetical protein
MIVQATTKTSTTIGSYYIPGLVINKEEGLFIRLHNEIINRTQLSLDFIIEPTQRIQQSFKSNQLIGYFPELWQNIPKDKSEIIVSDSIWLKSIIIFTRKNEQTITQRSDLEGLTLGAVRGYSYGQIEKNKNINIQYVNSEIQNIKKLLSGRIDAIIGDNASTVSAIKNSTYAQDIFYNLQQPIDILKVFYIFQNTTEGYEIHNKINIAIRSLKQEGLLKLDTKTGKSQILLPQ